MNAQKESFEFDLNTFYRLGRTERPMASIAVYAELLASMMIQGSRTIDCEVRFLSKTLKMGSHTVTETLNEFRRMGLVRFINSKGAPERRRRSSPHTVQIGSSRVVTFLLEDFDSL
jgi:hypothetical protein